MLKSMITQTGAATNFMKPVYLVFTIAGAIGPWFWLLQEPSAVLSPTLFLQQAFANTIATALSTDLIISAIVFLSFVWVELKRLQVSRVWIFLYIGLTFGIGLSCALPFFFYRREQLIHKNV